MRLAKFVLQHALSKQCYIIPPACPGKNGKGSWNIEDDQAEFMQSIAYHLL
jgi:hypothetical protein